MVMEFDGNMSGVDAERATAALIESKLMPTSLS